MSIGVILLTSPVWGGSKTLQLSNTEFFSPEETLLVSALHSWESDNNHLTTTHLDSLLLLAPQFELAQNLRQAVTSKPPQDKLYESFMAQPFSKGTKQELQQRWQYFVNPAPKNKIPANLLRLANSQRYVIQVDLNRNRIYLFENKESQPRLVADSYAGIGSKGSGKQYQGDRKTPVGVYFVTSQLADEELDELYGIGAFPINYPNALDKQRNRTGYGIWIHGVPRNTWTRAPQSSRGCVTVANRDFERLVGQVEPRSTPVILSNGINWVDANTLENQHNEILHAIEQWSQDWQSLDTKKYLQHYSAAFYGQQMDRAAWAEHKARVNERKQWIKIKLSDISLFKDPQENMVIATFLQDYQSNNFSSSDYKRQYWQQQEDGGWKILLENTL